MEWAGLGALIFLAGFVDAIAGGGGLISLPAYLAAGLDPTLLLGTNKLSSSVGTAVSTARYLRGHPFRFKPFLPAVAAALAGSALGARLALLLKPDMIRYLLLAALPLAAYAVLSGRRFGNVDSSHSLSTRALAWRSAAVSLPLACYDGFFGPGTGTFLALGFARFCGFDLVRATTGAKIINLSTNVAALLAFLAAGKVHIPAGLVMGALGVAGNYAGSGLAIRRGPAAIRPVIALVCAGLFLKIAVDVFFS